MKESAADTFVSKGFTNWKDATVAFQSHQQTKCHKDAVDVVITIPSTTKDVGELLSKEHAKEKEINRRMFVKIVTSIKYLARQGISLRGDGDEEDGNFMQLLRLRADDDPDLVAWLQRKQNKYTSHEIQNEILKTMAMSSSVLRNIASCLQRSPFLTLMMDESTDVSNTEQVVIVFRWVSDLLEVHEEFLGLYQVASIKAEVLYSYSTTMDCLKRSKISVAKLRGQCYDGASTMSGAKSGVAKRIQDEEPRAVLTHCYGHAISLAICDVLKHSKPIKHALEVTHEITNLIKYSPRRESIFKQVKETNLTTGSGGIRVLCPTRLTVRADSLASIISNFDALLITWEEALEAARDTETKARIIGVATQMRSFEFFFGAVLGEKILRHSDNLSQTLQSATMSAVEGQKITSMVVNTLKAIRSDEAFELFWKYVTGMAMSLGVEDPVLPRKRKTLNHLTDVASMGTEYFPSTPIELYRQLYFEALDSATSCIVDRMEQPGYKVYSVLEQLLLKSCTGDDFEECFQTVCSFYKDDFQPDDLRSQLTTFGVNVRSTLKDCSIQPSIFDIKNYFLSLSKGQCQLIHQVLRLLQLILVMPATNATSERSFSALRRVKTYLRSTMSQVRLNNLLLLHVHKNCTDSLDARIVGNDFVEGSEHRLRVFGKF